MSDENNEAQSSEHDALLQWIDSAECSYSGMRDRLLLGHHAMRVAAGLPTFASFTAAATKGKAETATKVKLRETQKALEDAYAELQRTVSRGEEERRVSEVAIERLEADRLEAIERLEADRLEAIERLNRERASHAEALSIERDRLSEERAKMSSQQADILARLADVAEARGRLEAREAEARARVEAREAEARARAEAREADAHSRLEAKMAGIHSEEVRRLRAELDRLKGTNHVKGVEGETTVSSAIRSVHPFDSWTFVDTSGAAGSSDFHMVSPKGETLVVEVKNKITVTAGDVSKSQRDVSELRDRLGDAFLGYLFVSLRSRSIPGKGALNLEVPTSQSIPILWCGLEDNGSDAMRDVVRSTRLLLDFGRALRASRMTIASSRASEASEASEVQECEKRRKEELEAALRKLNAQLEQLDEMRKIAARLSESASVTRRHAASMQSAIDTAFTTLDAYRVSAAALGTSSTGLPDASNASNPDANFECSICGKVCASKNGLSNHARFCQDASSSKAKK